MKKVKGIVLYSGGLDSLLAAKVLMDQGVEVTGYHCILPFTAPDFPRRIFPFQNWLHKLACPWCTTAVTGNISKW